MNERMMSVTSLLEGDRTIFGIVKTVAATDRRGTRYSVVFDTIDGDMTIEFSSRDELALKA